MKCKHLIFLAVLLTPFLIQSQDLKNAWVHHVFEQNQVVVFEKTYKNGKEILQCQTPTQPAAAPIQFTFEKINKTKKEPASQSLSSLLFRDYDNISSLSKMRQMRLATKNDQNPYATWKLLYVFNENDIIYSCSRPELGPYSNQYTMIRLIKKKDCFLTISYTSPSFPQEENAWLQWFASLKITS